MGCMPVGSRCLVFIQVLKLSQKPRELVLPCRANVHVLLSVMMCNILTSRISVSGCCFFIRGSQVYEPHLPRHHQQGLLLIALLGLRCRAFNNIYTLLKIAVVSGCCFLIGGFKFKSQMFSATINKASCSLLFLACIAIVIPTAAPVFYDYNTLSDGAVNNISHSTAIILVLV